MAGPGRKPTTSDNDILDIFHEASDPVLTTQEVADRLTIGRRGTYQRLDQLAQDNKIKKKKVGSGTVWWSSDALKNQSDL